MTTKLTQQELKKLKDRLDNQYAKGPFLGMIFNAYVTGDKGSIEDCLQKAIQVEIEAERLINEELKNV